MNNSERTRQARESNAAICDDFRAGGGTIAELMARWDVSRSKVYSALRADGLLSPRHVGAADRRSQLAARNAEICQEYKENGLTAKELVVKYGVDYGELRQIFGAGGLMPRYQHLLPRQPAPLTAQEVAICRSYSKDGVRVTQLAEKWGITRATVQDALRRGGVTLRDERTDRYAATLGERNAEICRRYRAGGTTLKALAEEYGMSKNNVAKLLKRHARNSGYKEEYVRPTEVCRRTGMSLGTLKRLSAVCGVTNHRNADDGNAWIRARDVETLLTKHVEERDAERRFRSRVKVQPNGCHEWQGARGHYGYGGMHWRGRRVGAHVIAWEIAHGQPVPDGLWVLHKCDNPPCVNPDHLFVGTPKDNTQDARRKGRLKQRRFSLTSKQVEYALQQKVMGVSYLRLARQFDVGYAYLQRTLRRAAEQNGTSLVA